MPNGRYHNARPVFIPPVEERMAIYDSFPPEYREVLRNAPANVSEVSAKRAIEAGYSPNEMEQLIWEALRDA